MLRKEREFSGQSVIATSPTLREAIDTFLKRRELKQDVNAIRRWRWELGRFETVTSKVLLKDIDRTDVEAFWQSFKDEGAAPRTIYNRVSALLTFPTDVGRPAVLPKDEMPEYDEKPVDYYNENNPTELDSFFNACTPEEHIIIPIISQNARVKMAIDSRGFIVMAKRYAVDDTVQACVNQLKAPQVPKSLPEASDPVQESISRWLEECASAKRRRADWFNRLTQDEQRLVRDVLEDCAGEVLGNFFCLIDGVCGNYNGVFEIVAVDGDERKIVNPQNTEMLHDLFSEICEQDQRRNMTST